MEIFAPNKGHSSGKANYARSLRPPVANDERVDATACTALTASPVSVNNFVCLASNPRIYAIAATTFATELRFIFLLSSSTS